MHSIHPDSLLSVHHAEPRSVPPRHQRNHVRVPAMRRAYLAVARRVYSHARAVAVVPRNA